MRDNGINEILGDKDAKAVRLNEGKVFSSQVIIFTECREDLRLFTDSGLQVDGKIKVNDQFQTNIESIYAVDQVSILKDSEPITPWSVLQEQGFTVAAAINDQQRSSETSPTVLNLNVEGLTITVIGQTKLMTTTEIRRTFDEEIGSYRGLYLEDNCLVGAVLVNAESEKDELLKVITEKGCIEPAHTEPY